KNMFIEAIEKIDNSNLLNEDGIIVVEHDTNDLFPDKICKLEKTRDKKYGNTTLTFYKMEA
ncbi:TPA: RsmD family RNA methyltransferase, partial [Clostridioides difficile]|nr:RsmD family RNA methyltransferase [Clostridioides difficile]